MFVKVFSASNSGLETIKVDVEVNVSSKGLPVFNIVGLPSKAVDESKERVRAAIVNSKLFFPSKKIIVNLAPADVPKEGSFYDLPIAIGILSESMKFGLPSNSLFFGELSLDGSLRHTKGALLFSLFAKENGFENVFLPEKSANEARIVKGINIYPINNLLQLVNFLLKKEEIVPLKCESFNTSKERDFSEFDMSEILGQEQAKRAVEIAAAGGHNIFMVGSPGSGKTMLSRAIPGILPPLLEEESIEVTKIYSSAGYIPPEGSLIIDRPFRSPHHTISQIGLIGGGSKPQPGEVSLAHRGVLFLDEFNEFPRLVMESLRQPLEDGFLTISRSRERVTYPARFVLVASANPCPCGYLNHFQKNCSCTEREIKKYRSRISGPILDRIDLHTNVPAVDIKKISEGQSEKQENSKEIRERVLLARKIQEKRFLERGIYANSEMKNIHIKEFCFLTPESKKFLDGSAIKFQLSARSYFKVIKVARTIADLESEKDINIAHIAEALQYRAKNVKD